MRKKGFGSMPNTASIDRKTARYLAQIKSRQLEKERISKAQEKLWTMLEKHLGTSFRQNLLAALTEIVKQNAHPSAIAGWLARVSIGVSKAVSGNPENTYLYMILRTHLMEKHPAMHDRIQSVIASRTGVSQINELLSMGLNPILDIAIAAGIENLDTPDAAQRLALVWPGGSESIKFLTQCLQYQEGV